MIDLTTLSISLIPEFTRSRCSSPGANSWNVILLTIFDPLESCSPNGSNLNKGYKLW